MKHTQLVLNFGRSVMRHLRLLPELRQTRRSDARLRRDPILENLANQLARAAGCRDLKSVVYWNPRLRTTAGLACWQRKAIYLNPKLIEISPSEAQKTLRHELAHLVAQSRAGRRHIEPHGEEWRQACRDVGIPNEPRCHNLPLKARRLERKFFYSCRECGALLARVRPPRMRVACIKCCRKHNNGQYHDRYRFVPTAPPDRAAA